MPAKKVEVGSVTIIGGTGTLGQELLRTITDKWPLAHVTVVSRDEHKQSKLKKFYPKASFAIACIRDYGAISPHISGRDMVFHVAAMKHVDIIEANPAEARKTNVEGTENVARACLVGNVKYMVYSSTDKAVDPINTYGFTKALSEKHLYNLNVSQRRTAFSVYRWGNVLGSQGSAIPFFIETLTNEKKVYLTHPDMTRFWIPIAWAVRYMLTSFSHAYKDRAMVPPNMKTATILEIVHALAEMLGVGRFEIIYTGIRPGEKIHEAMYSDHTPVELVPGHSRNSRSADRYTKAELIDMLMPFVPHFRLAA